MSCGEDDPGKAIEYRFVDDKTVEVTTKRLVAQFFAQSTEFVEKRKKRTIERFNLEDLYNNPRSRVFPSEAEK